MTIIRYHLGWQRRFPAQAWASALRPGRLSRRYGRPRRTSRSEPLTRAIRANTGSQRVARPVPVQGSGSVADTVRDVRPRCGTLCALHTRQERRDQSIAALPRSSSARCRDCRATVLGNSLFGTPSRAWASWGRATEPDPLGCARRRFMARYRSEERQERDS